MIFVGIDCGKEGALATMDGDRKHIEVHDTPLLADGSFDLLGAYNLMRRACWNGAAETVVTIEDTVSIPHMAKGQRFLPASDKTLHFSLGAWCPRPGSAECWPAWPTTTKQKLWPSSGAFRATPS